MTDVVFRWYDWHALDADTLYGLLRLRADVFIVEQQCAYADIDGLDPRCLHLCGHDTDGNLLAYLRLLPPGVKVPQVAIGRLVVHPSARGGGLGRRAMREALMQCAERYPGQSVFLSGQAHLQRFYASLGFAPISAPYLEDGIPHIDMLRKTP
ncbi:ElaA protein [Fontimonas thermophila]|uniref:ElaA protein n=1 Tax=Fontimonas thermophila TaxID=1076937 RepID=A0A1I2IF14_9GAMM|nr:GNAT family N-acetyltransferase [Fontimonas thermophila]SFF40814.1 ElaA protein [Fontimonas thermophila]